LTVRAGRPEGWNKGKDDDGVSFLSGAVGVKFFAGIAGFEDAGGQAKETRRRRAGSSGTGGHGAASGGRPRLGGTAAVVFSGV